MVRVAGKHDAYLATPPADKAHQGAGILFIPDVIGIWQNSKLLADQFAANGYLTLLLDMFNGDPVQLNRKGDFNLMDWLNHGTDGKNPHTKEYVDPIVEDGLKALKEEYGITKIGSVGYCFGAKVRLCEGAKDCQSAGRVNKVVFVQYVVRHYKNGINVGYLAHPSFVDEEELQAITGPLAISAAETDHIFPPEKRHRSEEILKKGGHPYQINLFSGVEHGFAVRGDVAVKAQKFGKEQAFQQAVTWFNEYLL